MRLLGVSTMRMSSALSSCTSSSSGSFLLFDQLGDALDQLGLLHLIGNFGDDDLVHAARAVFLVPARAHAE